MKKKIILILFSIILVLLILFIIFRNVSLGYDYIIIDKTTNSMEITVPKYSFDLKETDNNISIKSFQSNRIIKKELDKILSKYERISCDNKEYYYSSKDKYTIIKNGINNHFIFNTIYFKYVNYNYCGYLKANEYSEKLDGLLRMYTFGSKITDNKNISVSLINTKTTITDEQFEADLRVSKKGENLEHSIGYFIIEDDKLIYTRTNIITNSEDIIIPKISAFIIVEPGVFKLDDNYLSKYESEIILK